MGYTKKYPKFQTPRWLGSAASRLGIYTKLILKNTKEKSGNRKFQFLALKTVFRISKMVGCIPVCMSIWASKEAFEPHD